MGDETGIKCESTTYHGNWESTTYLLHIHTADRIFKTCLLLSLTPPNLILILIPVIILVLQFTLQFSFYCTLGLL